MADFVVDTFTETTDTTLASHTGETGATWTKIGTPELVADGDDNCRHGSSSGVALYYASGTPAGADYDVSVDIVTTTETRANSFIGWVGRFKTDATQFYMGRWNNYDGRWELYLYDSGFTLLGSWTSSIADNTTVAAVLSITDSEKAVWVAGTKRITHSNNDVTAAGKVGLRFSAGTSEYGLRYDNFTASDTGGGGGLSITIAMSNYLRQMGS